MSEASNNFDMNLLKRGAKAFQNYVDTAASNLENIPRTNFVGNAALGVAQYGMPLVQMVAHPIQTAENLAYAAQHIPETANAIIEQQKQYYNPKNLKQNFYKDPVKPLRDVADIANTVQIAKDAANVAKTVNNAAKIVKDVKNIENTTQPGIVGSPVKFDKFSKSAIGSGEGNAAHGYGFYANKQDFLLNPTSSDRAYGYSNIGRKYRMDFEDYGDYFTPQGLSMIKENPIATLDYWKRQLATYEKNLTDPKTPESVKEVSRRLAEELKGNISDLEPIVEKSKGDVFDVRMPKEDVMLNEQNIMATQPAAVQDAMKAFNSRMARDIARDYDKFKNFINHNNIDINKALGTKYTNEAFDVVNKNPALLEPHLNRQLQTGKEFYENLAKYFGTKKAASEWLDAHGVKGISYKGSADLDANVIFNENNIYKTPEWFLSGGGMGAIRQALDARLETPNISTYPYIYTIAQPNHIRDFDNRMDGNGKI